MERDQRKVAGKSEVVTGGAESPYARVCNYHFVNGNLALVTPFQRCFTISLGMIDQIFVITIINNSMATVALA